MEALNLKKILIYLAGLVVLTVSTLAFACPVRSHRDRWRDPRVNTRIEARFDRNHDGWIDRRERRHIHQARYGWNHGYRGYDCDYNRNGWIDSYRERHCR